ncbi:MAG TPA: prolyl oligopeptidase family serine peptidase [Polyangiaceae bacterium]
MRANSSNFAVALTFLAAACASEPPAPPPSVPVAPTAAPAATASATAEAGPALPATPQKPVIDTYFGTQVTDPYRWLEDARDPEVQAWSDAQNVYARAHLDAIPSRQALHGRLHDLMSEPSPNYFGLTYRGGKLLALELLPPKQQPMLVVMTAAADPTAARVLLDPMAVDPSGATTIDWYWPSLDGKWVAVSLSQNGSEDGTLHVYDVATGKESGEPIPRVCGGTAGCTVAWTAGAKGFFYTRYPRAGERPPEDMPFYQQVYFHTMGKPVADDTFAFGKDLPRIAEIFLRPSDDGTLMLADVQNGDGGEYAFWWARTTDPKTWTKIAGFEDGYVNGRFGPDDQLYLLAQKATPRRHVVRVDLHKPAAAPVEVVPPSEAVITDFSITKSKLFTLSTVGGPSELRAFTRSAGGAAKLDRVIQTPVVSTVDQVVRLEGDEILFEDESYVQPSAWYRWAPGKDVMPTALKRTSKADFGDAEVVRTTCTSRDGTKVPMTVVRKKGTKLDGSSPALLTGYGGYDIIEQPWFGVQNRVWLDLGGVFADANIRGGGDWGEEWHRAGNLTHKQNVFDDFYACAQELVSQGYTRPEKLAIEGGSNGGLLMGAAFTQHPDAFRAVVSHVGIYDMLRVELNPNGAFNVTEFGTVKDPDQFKALFAYSPYHHVVDGTKYPAILMLTGAFDPRVDPSHSRKMIARLQAASNSGLPVLLRTSAKTGHGMGTPLDEHVDQEADVFAFLAEQLGLSLP